MHGANCPALAHGRAARAPLEEVSPLPLALFCSKFSMFAFSSAAPMRGRRPLWAQARVPEAFQSRGAWQEGQKWANYLQTCPCTHLRMGSLAALSSVASGQLPADLQSEEIQAKLPAFFRAIRGQEYVADDGAKLSEGVKKLHHW